MYKLIIPLVTFGLTACTSTSDTVNLVQCTNNNWTDVGYKIAKEGKSVRNFSKFEELCGEKLAENAKSLYLNGYSSGIKEYCTYDNGQKLGSKGIPNNNNCPFELREQFDKGHKVAALVLKEKKAMVKKMQEMQNVGKKYENVKNN